MVAASDAAAAADGAVPPAVTPWNVEGEVDYMKLVKEFGTELIEPGGFYILMPHAALTAPRTPPPP